MSLEAVLSSHASLLEATGVVVVQPPSLAFDVVDVDDDDADGDGDGIAY